MCIYRNRFYTHLLQSINQSFLPADRFQSPLTLYIFTSIHLLSPQDSNGPISRTVSDAALILEIIVNQTVVEINNVNASYTQFLDPHGLQGKRIGFSRDILATVEVAPGMH
jgi:hypothetical protein